MQDGVEREWAWANRWCGADEVLDTLLDQEGLEVDPVDRLEKDTPLHKAVRFINGLAKKEWEAGSSIVELLLDAGADPRYGLTHPFMLVLATKHLLVALGTRHI